MLTWLDRIAAVSLAIVLYPESRGSAPVPPRRARTPLGDVRHPLRQFVAPALREPHRSGAVIDPRRQNSPRLLLTTPPRPPSAPASCKFVQPRSADCFCLNTPLSTNNSSDILADRALSGWGMPHSRSRDTGHPELVLVPQ